MHVGGFDAETAAVPHGIARIDNQIENRIFELIGIAERRPQSGSSPSSIWIEGPVVRRNSSSIETMSSLTSTGRDASGWRREKASSRCVREAARLAEFIAPST